MAFCIHCGQQHPVDARFCATTGKPLPEAAPPPAAPPLAASTSGKFAKTMMMGAPMPASPPPPSPSPPVSPPAATGPAAFAATTAVPTAAIPPAASPPSPSPPESFGSERPGPPLSFTNDDHADKGVIDLLGDAFKLYTTHFTTLLAVCAVLMVPVSLLKTAIVTAFTAPLVGRAELAGKRMEGRTQRLQEMSKRFEEAARKGQADPAAQEEMRREGEKLAREAIAETSAAVGGMGAFFLGLLASVITLLFLMGVVVPLTNGALTIAVADRRMGGTAGVGAVWSALFSRLGKLLATFIPQLLIVGVGLLFLILPGLILAFLFVFSAQVVLVEGRSGLDALKRSRDLVVSDWLRVAIMLIVFAIVSWFAHWLGALFVPASSVFLSSFVGDLVAMALMPFPVIGAVLLYLDVRRKMDGQDDTRLRDELAALRV